MTARAFVLSSHRTGRVHVLTQSTPYLVISILLVGGVVVPSTAGECKTLAKISLVKPMSPEIIYVDEDATGPTYDITSWNNAYVTVQDALTTVLSGDIDHETNPDTTDINGVVVDTNLNAEKMLST